MRKMMVVSRIFRTFAAINHHNYNEKTTIDNCGPDDAGHSDLSTGRGMGRTGTYATDGMEHLEQVCQPHQREAHT